MKTPKSHWNKQFHLFNSGKMANHVAATIWMQVFDKLSTVCQPKIGFNASSMYFSMSYLPFVASLAAQKVKIGPLDLSSRQPKQAQFTWVHWWKLLLWIDLLSCYSLILVYTWIYKYVYENMGMETFTINSCPVSDKWNFEYCKVAFSLPR